jgi:hypothetical protein
MTRTLSVPARSTIDGRAPLRRGALAVQKRRTVDPCHPGDEMRETDEAAEQAVAVESVGEIGMPRAPNHIAFVPIGARLVVEQRPQAIAIEPDVGGRGRFAEKLPELGVVGEGADAGELEQREMRLVEIDCIDLRRCAVR